MGKHLSKNRVGKHSSALTDTAKQTEGTGGNGAYASRSSLAKAHADISPMKMGGNTATGKPTLLKG